MMSRSPSAAVRMITGLLARLLAGFNRPLASEPPRNTANPSAGTNTVAAAILGSVVTARS